MFSRLEKYKRVVKKDIPLTRKELWRQIIFETETRSGKFFDVILLIAIILSVTAVMLESIGSIELKYGKILFVVEYFFTFLFTIEYLLRILLVRRPIRYIFSFYGVVDFLSCLPTYLAFIFTGASSLLMIRILRLLRIFRVLKMGSHVRGCETILIGLMESRAKILVFFFSVFIFTILAGTVMYLVESVDPNTKFNNIPISIYYAIVSITTVGYGDMVAATVLGKVLTSFFVLSGYAIIAVPTGIVTSELLKSHMNSFSADACPGCGVQGHLPDAKYCRRCGERFKLNAK